MDGIDMAEDRNRGLALVNIGNEPLGSIKCGEFFE
jgi:hypothetical protein